MRFFAALIVLVSHVELVKEGLKVNHIYGNSSILANFLEMLGPTGVTFFFVLSGFLITYLLLCEQTGTQKINIRNFYLRRMLRIWPIYILFTLMAFFLLPKIDFFYHYYLSPQLANHLGVKLTMYLCFIPGFVLAFYKSIPWAGHLWSIGVEEQFYLAWPWLTKRFSNRFFLSAIVLIITLKAAAVFYISLNQTSSDWWLKQVLAQSKFECMIIGGWAAFLLKNNRLDRICNWGVKYLLFWVTLIFALLIFIPTALNDVLHILLSPLFVLVILGFIFSKKLKWAEHPIFIFLGNISYGFYIYHMAVIVLVIKLMPNAINYWCANNFGGNLVINVLYYTLSVILTIFIGGLSYYFFEKRFLKYKGKFAIVKSGK